MKNLSPGFQYVNEHTGAMYVRKLHIVEGTKISTTTLESNSVIFINSTKIFHSFWLNISFLDIKKKDDLKASTPATYNRVKKRK
jgi:hypothetical protein